MMDPMSPPDGKRAVVLTREPPDNDALAGLLEAEGFEVLAWPAVATEWLVPPDGAKGFAAACARADCVVFTSRRGVAAAERLLKPAGGLAGTLGDRAAAAVGPATARALEAAGVAPALVAGGRGWRELADCLLDALPQDCALLLVRSAAAEQGLPEALAAEGRLVEDVRLHGPGAPPAVKVGERPLTAIVCASPSAARRLVAWNPWAAARTFVSIGPTTTRVLADELGIARIVEAAGPTDSDLLNAIRAAARETEDQ
jgi:uroporphyrinogen-III synthase